MRPPGSLPATSSPTPSSCPRQQLVLASSFGRKRFLMSWRRHLHRVASFACGAAPTLPLMLLARVIQGAGGGALQPLSQAILLESFPPAKRGAAMAVFAFGVVVAPVLGPTLGGWLTDTYSWRYAFYINIPIGLLALFMIGRFIKDPGLHLATAKVPATSTAYGLAALIIWTGALQVILDKGQEVDWFGASLDPLVRRSPWSSPSSTGVYHSRVRQGHPRRPQSPQGPQLRHRLRCSSSYSASPSTPPPPSCRSSTRSSSATPPSPPESPSPRAAWEPSAACPSSASSPTRSTHAYLLTFGFLTLRLDHLLLRPRHPRPLPHHPAPAHPPHRIRPQLHLRAHLHRRLRNPATTSRSATPPASSTSCATSAAPSASPSPKPSSPAAADAHQNDIINSVPITGQHLPELRAPEPPALPLHRPSAAHNALAAAHNGGAASTVELPAAQASRPSCGRSSMSSAGSRCCASSA